MDQEQNTNRGRTSVGDNGNRSGFNAASDTIAEAAADTAAELGGFARRTGEQAKEAVVSAASRATEGAENYADRQLDWGVEMLGHVADSVRAAADNLSETAPPLGAFAREAADRMETFSRSLRGQSVRDLAQTASDFARRRPAVVLGAAAAVGFLLVRMVNTAPPRARKFKGDRNGSGFEGAGPGSQGGRSRGGASKGSSYAKRTPRSAQTG